MDEPARPAPPPPPWGTHRPPLPARILRRVTRAIPGWRGVKQLAHPVRRLARLFLDGPVDAELWGQRLRFRSRGNISEGRLLFMPHLWDRTERSHLARYARPGTVFVDVGANFGGYTWWMLSLLGKECRVVALEPDPELNARLRFNLETNGWDQVTLLPYAAGAEEGTAVLHISGLNKGQNTLLQEGAEGESGTVRVPVRTLESVLRETGVERVDILKIDIEGLEPPVLGAFFRDADPALWPGLVVCEWKEAPEYAALGRLLDERGYVREARTRLNTIFRKGSRPPAGET